MCAECGEGFWPTSIYTLNEVRSQWTTRLQGLVRIWPFQTDRYWFDVVLMSHMLPMNGQGNNMYDFVLLLCFSFLLGTFPRYVVFLLRSAILLHGLSCLRPITHLVCSKQSILWCLLWTTRRPFCHVGLFRSDRPFCNASFALF